MRGVSDICRATQPAHRYDPPMPLPGAGPSDLSVDDSARSSLGKSIVATLVLAVAFVAFTWSTKEVGRLYVHQSWQG